MHFGDKFHFNTHKVLSSVSIVLKTESSVPYLQRLRKNCFFKNFCSTKRRFFCLFYRAMRKLCNATILWESLFKVAFHWSVLAGRKELILASLNGKVQGARVHFSRHNSPNSRALADRSGRTERLWSMSRAIMARTSSENSCVPLAIRTTQMESDLL